MHLEYETNETCKQIGCNERAIVNGLCRSDLMLYRALRIKREATYEANRIRHFVERNAERRKAAAQVLIRLILNRRIRWTS